MKDNVQNIRRRFTEFSEDIRGIFIPKVYDFAFSFVLPHILGEIFRAIFSGLVDFSLILLEALVSFRQVSVNFSFSQTVLGNFSQS